MNFKNYPKKVSALLILGEYKIWASISTKPKKIISKSKMRSPS